MNKQIIIYVVRHGQAELNTKHTIGGTFEPNPLTSEGEKQAGELAKKLENIQINKVYSSDLSRAKQTAGIIAKSKNLSLETNELLRERDWGSLQGKTFAEAQKEYPQVFEEEQKIEGEAALDFTFVSDMESLRSAITRFNKFINKILKIEQGKTILIVSHFDIMMGYLLFLGYGTYQDLLNANFDHAGYYTLIYDGHKISISQVIGLHINHL